MITSIASYATALKQQELAVEVGSRLMKKALETGNDLGEGLQILLDESKKSLELSVNPSLGSQIDLYA